MHDGSRRTTAILQGKFEWLFKYRDESNVKTQSARLQQGFVNHSNAGGIGIS
jgi:hypothetical protein